MGDLDSLTALVTGGSQGIGLAVAKALSEDGARVAICARDEARLEQASREIEQGSGTAAHTISADLSTTDGVERATAAAMEALGKVDILVNNAGAAPPGGIEDLTEDQWDLALDLKLRGYIRTTRSLLGQMTERGFGRIVNIAGGAGKEPGAMSLSNGVTNGGVYTLTKGVATAVAGNGVTVNAVCPGMTLTQRFDRIVRATAERDGVSEEEARERLAGTIPTGRFSTPDDIAHAVMFFVSPRARQVTGQLLFVNGGAIRAL
jgi:NAD(P)-dependent dehydrogenase (short-subunit alcohol dehydrogenase family)